MENDTNIKVNTNDQSNSLVKKIMKTMRNWGCGFLILLAIIAGGYLYWQYYYVFGSGVKAGTLNYVVLKGDVFKTYEGKLIMEGVESRAQGQLQSNTFVFSIEDEELAQKLMRMSGKNVELQYKEYHGALPWRGHSVFVVDSLLSYTSDTLPATQPI